MSAPALPTIVPTPGNVAKVQVTVVGGSAVVLPGMNATLSDDAKLKDVSNFRDGRVRVATLHDANFKIDIVWDSAANPTLSANGTLKPGTSLFVEFETNASSNPFSGNFMIGTAEYENPGMEEVALYHVTGELLGTLTYPSS